MNFSFSFHLQYTSDKSIDNVRLKLKSTLERPWSDFSEDIIGKLNDDDTFKVSPKWSFGSFKVLGVEQDLTFIIGKISKQKKGTTIETIVRPNHAILIIFYFFIFLTITELFGLTTLLGGKGKISLLMFPLMALFFAGIMRVSIIKMKCQFENLMKLDSE